MFSFCFPCVQFGRNANPLLPCSSCFACGCFFFVCSHSGVGHCVMLQNRILIRNDLGYRVRSSPTLPSFGYDVGSLLPPPPLPRSVNCPQPVRGYNKCVTQLHHLFVLIVQRDDVWDCIKIACCLPCVLAQEGRELKAKGKNYH